MHSCSVIYIYIYIYIYIKEQQRRAVEFDRKRWRKITGLWAGSHHQCIKFWWGWEARFNLKNVH